ncbi:MAG: winged helix-turn-helix transcriptional regulator [Thermoplasmata archaeon]
MNRLERKIIKVLESGNKTQTQLRKELNISKSYLSEILNKMEGDGYLKKEKISERTVLVSINKEKILNIGILKATEYAAVFLSQKDLNALVINIFSYNNALEEMRALITEKIDIAFAPIITGFIFHLMDHRIVLLSACAKGGSGIVYHKKDGILGSTMLSTMDFQSRKYLKDFKSIKYFLSPEEMIRSYNSNQIQAISIWEPFFSALKKERKIFHGKDNFCCGFLVLKDKINRSVLEFYKKFIKNTSEIRNGPRIDEAAILMSKFFKLDKNLIKESMKSYDFTNEIDPDEILYILKNFGIIIDKENVQDFIK